jgi:plasmid stabilization system protein ParE
VRLFWTEPSLADLASIDRWLSLHADPDIAVDQLQKIRARARRLRDFPASGEQVGTERRSVPVQRTPYILVYRVKGGEIEILRVHHYRQDWRPAR